MPTIVLIHPGSTDFDEQGRIQGTLDVPLNPRGDGEVAQLARDLQDRGIEAVYCSNCEPAIETASQVAEALDVKLKKIDGLRNLDHGLWQGLRVDEVKQKQPKIYRQWQEQPERICPPQGETLEEARKRVQGALKKLLKRHQKGTIGLVVPEPLCRLVRSELSQTELGNLWTAGDAHGQWEVIEVDAKPALH